MEDNIKRLRDMLETYFSYKIAEIEELFRKLRSN